MIDAAQGADERGGDGVRSRTQLRRVRPEAAKLPARRVAARPPVVFGPFMVVEMKAFPAQDERDVKLRQFNEEPPRAPPGAGNELLAPREERQVGVLRQLKALVAPPVALRLTAKAQQT